MSKILRYNGEIIIKFCWAQEIFGYHSGVIHIPAHMMAGVDFLTRRFDSLTYQYVQATYLLSNFDRKARPSAYTYTFKDSKKAKKIYYTVDSPLIVILVLTTDLFSLSSSFDNNVLSTPDIDIAPLLLHIPVTLHSTVPSYNIVDLWNSMQVLDSIIPM